MGSQRIKLNCKKGVLISPIDFRFQFSSSGVEKVFTFRSEKSERSERRKKNINSEGCESGKHMKLLKEEQRKKVLVSIEKQINCRIKRIYLSLEPWQWKWQQQQTIFAEQKVLNLSAFSADSFRNT